MMLLACASLGVVASILVIIGLRLNKRIFLVPWIIVMIADLLVECAHFIYLIVIQTLQFEPVTAMLFTIDFFIMCLNIYCLLCVISQYQEYKAGRGAAEADSYTSAVHIQYSPPVATCLPPGKSILSPVMCPHTNCTLIPEETQINGVILGSTTHRSPTVFSRENSLLLKKHVKFNSAEKTKVCCSGVIHPESVKAKDGVKPNGHMVQIETLPEYNEEMLSWKEQKMIAKHFNPPEK
ncbi:uncharacterized protein LOC134211180 [Armigeres subalbatus]|uniref:uncharacterized protein LOC134211180 n=1 Tax=Armigeres subalbatus TaxID=124917 RepID=UPI002ED22D2F